MELALRWGVEGSKGSGLPWRKLAFQIMRANDPWDGVANCSCALEGFILVFIIRRASTIFHFLYDMTNPWKTIKNTIFTPQHRVSLGLFTCWWWRHNWLCNAGDKVTIDFATHNGIWQLWQEHVKSDILLSRYRFLCIFAAGLVSWTLIGTEWINQFIIPIVAYMRRWTGSALVQAMACHLFGAKPLPEPMLAYCKIDPLGQILVKFESTYKTFIHENVFEKAVYEMAAILSRGRWVNRKSLWTHPANRI